MTFSTALKCPSWEFLFGHTLSLSPIQPDLIGCTPFKFVRSVELCVVGAPKYERPSIIGYLPMEKINNNGVGYGEKLFIPLKVKLTISTVALILLKNK